MKRDLAGCRCLITGATGGIGRCLADQLAQLNCRLILASRKEGPLADLAQRISKEQGQVLAFPADVTIEEDRRRLMRAAESQMGGLDILVNNAGIGSFAHFADSSEEILRQIMEVNFFAPAELIRLAIPILVKGRQPAIVNVSSMCGRRGIPAWSEYSASKFALCGLTEALRGELARFDIDILLIVPGLTSTDLRRNLLKNTGRMKIEATDGMPAEKVAAGIVRGLQKNATETVLGRDARWILRLNRFFPRIVDRLIARKVRQLYSQTPHPTLSPGGREKGEGPSEIN